MAGFCFGFEKESETSDFASSITNQLEHERSVTQGSETPTSLQIFEPNCELISDLPSMEYDNVPINGNATQAPSDTEEKLYPTINMKRVRVLENRHLFHHSAAYNSDLIPGVYEGGLKTWECSIDLCNYLYNQYRADTNDLTTALDSNGITLELGCGHGLPGILVSRLGSANGSKVVFSDYNDFVLEIATWPNLLLNTPDVNRSSLLLRVTLLSGDWMQLSEDLVGGSDCRIPGTPSDGRFNLILAAETTYTEASARDTATLLSRHLKFDSGIGLVATKRYYFVVGGGSDSFRSFAEKIRVERIVSKSQARLYSLQVETVKVYDSGIGIIREVLRVKLVDSEERENDRLDE